MKANRTRRGMTIQLTEGETTELLTALALSMAAHGLLQNFMTAAQKSMTLPSMLFVSRLGATVAAARDQEAAAAESATAS